jgi:hypothetical protein
MKNYLMGVDGVSLDERVLYISKHESASNNNYLADPKGSLPPSSLPLPPIFPDEPQPLPQP